MQDALGMAIPRAVAGFNSHFTNHATRSFAGRIPGFGIVIDAGRRSERTYRTPVNVFRDGERYIIALTYGAGSDWVKNVVAAGGCELQTRGRTVLLTDPQIVADSRGRLAPAPVRPVLRLIGASDFLILRTV